jgi:hypothetical protein
LGLLTVKHCLVCGNTFSEEETCPACNEILVTEAEYAAVVDGLRSAGDRLEIPDILKAPPPRTLVKKKTSLQRLSTYIFTLFAVIIIGMIFVYIIHDFVSAQGERSLARILIHNAPAFVLAIGFLLLVRYVTRKSRGELMEEYILSQGNAVYAQVAKKKSHGKHHLLIVRFMNEAGKVLSGAIVSQRPFDDKIGDFVLWVYTPGKSGRGLYVDQSLLETYAQVEEKTGKGSA